MGSNRRLKDHRLRPPDSSPLSSPRRQSGARARAAPRLAPAQQAALLPGLTDSASAACFLFFSSGTKNFGRWCAEGSDDGERRSRAETCTSGRSSQRKPPSSPVRKVTIAGAAPGDFWVTPSVGVRPSVGIRGVARAVRGESEREEREKMSSGRDLYAKRKEKKKVLEKLFPVRHRVEVK